MELGTIEVVEAIARELEGVEGIDVRRKDVERLSSAVLVSAYGYVASWSGVMSETALLMEAEIVRRMDHAVR